MMTQNGHREYPGLLSATNSALLLIDFQPQMVFGVQSVDRQTLINNVVALAKSAKVFNVPTVLTTVFAENFSGKFIPEVQAVFPDVKPIDRTWINAWEDDNFQRAVQDTGRKKLVMAALWTEICLTHPALCALADGYEVFCVVDASGGSSAVAHDMGVQRMIQAGAIPVTWAQVMSEWQRDWARETAGAVFGIALEHAGSWGVGINYVNTFKFPSPNGAVEAPAETTESTETIGAVEQPVTAG